MYNMTRIHYCLDSVYSMVRKPNKFFRLSVQEMFTTPQEQLAIDHFKCISRLFKDYRLSQMPTQ